METKEQRKARLKEIKWRLREIHMREIQDSLWVEIKVKKKIPTVTGRMKKIKA